ncbi:Collagenase and related proteases [Serratia liquefaciens]|nr:Collagenase and related proteases [Serratia liquefaciens]
MPAKAISAPFDSPKFIGLPVGEVLKVGKDHLDVEVSEPLTNGDGLNVMIKREVVGFRANTRGKNRRKPLSGIGRTRCQRICIKCAPHQPLNRNLDHNWQQALLKTSSERRIAVDVTLSGWQEQLVLTMTCEDGVSVTHTLDGEFTEANQAEKALANLRDGVTKLGQTIYYAREVQVNLPPLFVPNSLLNQLRRETAEMLDEARLNAWQRGTRKPVSVPPPVYPETHLSFLANVYNHKARAFYQRYGVQLIDAAYEAHEEKGDVPVMITKHCLRFAFNLCPKQAKGSIKSWKATPMQLIHGDEVLTLKFDCRPCEMHVVGKIKNHILKMPHPGSIVASVSPDDLMKTLPKRKGA